MTRVEFYILGLLEFDREAVVLSDRQLCQICECFTKRFGKFEKREPYYVWSLEKYFEKTLKQIKTGAKFKILQCEIGYYHHRVIFRLILDAEQFEAFGLIRAIREPLHQYVRTLLNETLPKKIERDCKRPAAQIFYVYTYPLVIIQNGRIIIKKQIKDTLFSIPTTTFFLEIPETSLITLRTHYIRISIPSVMVYSDKKLGDSVFRELVNGIYYAALYTKKMQHKGVFKNRNDDDLNELNEGVLCELSSYMLNGVVVNERHKIDTRTKTTALAFSAAAIIISVIAVLLKYILAS